MDWVKSILEGAKTTSEAVSAAAQLVDAHRGVGEKMQNLKRKLDELATKSCVKQKELGVAESLVKRRKADVETWLKQVEWIGADVQQMGEQVAQAGMLSRLELASRVDERTREVEQLIEQVESPITLDVEKTKSNEFPSRELVGQAFESNKQKILEYLRDDSVFIVGIHGMGGVGKTTLAKHIYNQLWDDGEIVRWITVSQECSIHKLQSDLVDGFMVGYRNVKLPDDKYDVKKRAASLRDFLLEHINVIILDDMWHDYSLEELGIPIGVDGCKLIITSRSSDLCRQMGCQKLLNVESLPDEEAWQLFRKNLDRRVPFTNEIEGIARSVANEGCGLPLGIIVLSGSMKGVEDIFEWRYVLEELRELRSTECVENEVFRVLKFSYDRLTDETVRQCFMHIALYPEDHEIKRSELVRSFIDAGLLCSRRKREAALNRGNAVINKLLGVCLLQCDKNSWEDCLKMHDLVRDMVISMTKTRFLVLPKLHIKEIRLEEWTEGLEKISLMSNDISEIPSGASPRCPKLSVLLLNGNPLKSIPNQFFKHMPALQLLDLSHTSIEKLPSSVKDLDKLAVLNLNDCHDLHDLPPLEKLAYLNLGESGLKTWPTISKFSHLQFLNLLGSKVQMKASDLKSLGKLEMLACHFGEVKEFNAYAEFLNDDGCVRCYELHLIGKRLLPWPYPFPKHGRRTKLEGYRANGNVLLPRGIEELGVSYHGGPRRSLSDLSYLPLMTFTDLKRCTISNWKSMECFISLASSSSILQSSGTILPGLETLKLHDCRKLRFVVEILEDGGHAEEASSETSPPPPRGDMGRTVSMFPCLRRLEVTICPWIQKLLTAALLRTLVNLEEIEVGHCEGMREIVASEATEGRAGAGDDVLVNPTSLPFHPPKLRSVHLYNLPELRSICRNKT